MLWSVKGSGHLQREAVRPRQGATSSTAPSNGLSARCRPRCRFGAIPITAKEANTMATLEKQVQEGFDGLKGQVNEKFSSVEDRLFNLEQRGAELPPGFGSTKRKSVVADALRCDQLAALQAGRTKSAVIPLTSSIKALVGDAGSSSDDSYSVLPQRAPEAMYNAPRRRLSLLDVMQSIQVASNSFEFVRLDGFTNAADYQLAEGDAKAEQPMPNQLVSANIATIAALLPTSEQ